MRFSDESLSRIEEAEKHLNDLIEKNAQEQADKKAKWDHYYEQLAKMPEYKPGSRKTFNPYHLKAD